jgi:hypothetical protein
MRSLALKRTAALIVVVVFLLTGCKAPPPPIVEAGGVVRLDGQPLKRAEVRFIPAIQYGAEYVAVGITDDAGRFTLTCKGQPGACACENFVMISEAPLPPELKGENAQAELARYFQKLGGRPLPAKYASLATNPLTATVTAERKDYDFHLPR